MWFKEYTMLLCLRSVDGVNVGRREARHCNVVASAKQSAIVTGQSHTDSLSLSLTHTHTPPPPPPPLTHTHTHTHTCRTCQQKDWGDHRRKCGKINVFPIGLPFVISLPTSQLTYSRLTDYAEKFARYILYQEVYSLYMLLTIYTIMHVRIYIES